MNASQKQVLICDFYGEDHDSTDCQKGTSSKQVNFIENFQGVQNNFNRPMQNQFQNRGMNRFPRPQPNPQNDPFAPTYNLGRRNHPNFSYKNQTQGLNQPPGFQAP